MASTKLPLDVLCTGDWRKNPERVELLTKVLGVSCSVKIFPQDKEGTNQALFLLQRLRDAGLVKKGIHIFIAGGRGSTQATVINVSDSDSDSDKFVVVGQDTSSGFPKGQQVPTEDKTAMVKRLKGRFPTPALIVLTDSFYHTLKVLEPAPTLTDKAPLPKTVERTGKDFPVITDGAQFEFVTEVFPDTPTLSIRNFKDSDGNLCKGTFIISDRPTVDLGTGKVRLVNPKTGTGILVDGQEEFELPDDWKTNDASIRAVATAISRMQSAAKSWHA